MAYPDLNPALTPTVRAPQCGHTVWGKSYLVWGVCFLISLFWPNHVRTENPFKPWDRNCKHQETQVWNRRHGLCPLRNFLKYIETTGQCQNGKPHHTTPNWSRGTNGEQGLKSFFRERHQFGPPVHLHSARRSSFEFSNQSDDKGTHAVTLWWTSRQICGPWRRKGRIPSAQAVRFKSCQTERNCLQVTTEANMHIPYIHISESVFFSASFSPVVCGCCALCILGIFLRVFVAFVCFLGSSVVWLLMFIGYLAAWLLVFFTCQWAHSWRHVAHLDRNSIFDVFVSWLCGFCIASLADVVF